MTCSPTCLALYFGGRPGLRFEGAEEDAEDWDELEDGVWNCSVNVAPLGVDGIESGDLRAPSRALFVMS